MTILVAKEAPDFIAPAVMPNSIIEENFKLSDLRGKYVVLFFWPLDFTFVCPTEIIAHDHRIDKFKKRSVEVVGVSIDSQFTHFAWRETPVDKGGIGRVQFPSLQMLNTKLLGPTVLNIPMPAWQCVRLSSLTKTALFNTRW